MNKYILWLALSLTGSVSLASTFIGNGGNSADLDLAAVLAQIAYITSDFDDVKVDDLCVAPDDFSDPAMRERLNSLTEDQHRLCVKLLKKYAPEIYKLASGSSIQYKWHTAAIYQELSDGKRRVDAITDRDKLLITIDEERFLGMDKLRRIALISHELFHLIEIDGKVLGDEGAFESFAGKQGQRDLLDVLGVSWVVYGESLLTSPEVQSLQAISRAGKNYWLGLSFGSATYQKMKPLLIKKREVSPGVFSFQYQPELWGLQLAASVSAIDNNSGNGYDVSLSRSSTEFGALYRYFPVNRYNSRLGQWFINGGLSVVFSTMDYVVSDDYVTESSHSQAYGATAHVDSMFPIVHNFWLRTGLTASYLPHELKEFKMKFDQIEFGLLGGIFYAW